MFQNQPLPSRPLRRPKICDPNYGTRKRDGVPCRGSRPAYPPRQKLGSPDKRQVSLQFSDRLIQGRPELAVLYRFCDIGPNIAQILIKATRARRLFRRPCPSSVTASGGRSRLAPVGAGSPTHPRASQRRGRIGGGEYAAKSGPKSGHGENYAPHDSCRKLACCLDVCCQCGTGRDDHDDTRQ